MIQIIAAILLVFIIPGLGLSFYLFRESQIIEKIIFGIGFSISFSVLLAFILGVNNSVKEATGGYAISNILLFLLIFSIAGLLLNLMRFRHEKK